MVILKRKASITTNAIDGGDVEVGRSVAERSSIACSQLLSFCKQLFLVTFRFDLTANNPPQATQFARK